MSRWVKYVLLMTGLVLTRTAVHAAIDPPDLRCIALDENDDVTLTWIAPSDPLNEFVSYAIYRINSGNVSLLDTVDNLATTSVSINGSFAGVNSFFLRVRFRDNVTNARDSSLTSDTLSAMIISPVNPAGNLEVVQLSWNPIRDPALATTVDPYTIFRKIGVNGAWNVIGTTTQGNEQFSDSLELLNPCNDTAFYRIEISDQSGCVSVSNYSSILVTDETKPETPFLRCVSVDTVTGRVVLNWNQSPSQDVQGYQVVRFDNGLNTVVADTNSPTATNIRDTTSGAQANDRFLLYSVVAYDDCEDPNTNQFNTSTTDQVIQTLFIEDPVVDICSRSITLNWNGAIGDTLVAVTDLAGFEIYASANFGPPMLVHSADSGDTAFVHEDLIFGVKYRYYMMALEKNTGKKALSNAVIGVMIPPNRPDTHYLNLVTVNPLDNVIEVSCLVDTSADVSRYGLLRSIRPNGPFQLVSTLTNSRKDRVITFRDLTAEADQLSYYYRVSVIDLCGATVLESNTSRSIYLQGSSNTINLVNELEWNPYSDWDTLGNGVARYNLYRVINGVIGPQPLAIDVVNFSYQDDFTDVRASDGNVCYVAEAVEAAGNAFGFQGVSRSNVQCFPQQPQLFIPNAFSPNFDGRNDVFHPMVNFVDPSNYLLMVYSRHGELLFETRDVNEGWDGIGYPIGVYAYRLVVRTVRNERIDRIGSVTLVK